MKASEFQKEFNNYERSHELPQRAYLKGYGDVEIREDDLPVMRLNCGSRGWIIRKDVFCLNADELKIMADLANTPPADRVEKENYIFQFGTKYALKIKALHADADAVKVWDAGRVIVFAYPDDDNDEKLKKVGVWLTANPNRALVVDDWTDLYRKEEYKALRDYAVRVDAVEGYNHEN